MADVPPALPTQYQIYNTYALDPPWQVHYTIAWTGMAALFTIFSLPRLYRSLRHGRSLHSIRPISQDLALRGYKPITQNEKPSPLPSYAVKRTSFVILSSWKHVLLWTLPGFGLDLGQIILVILYAVLLCFCVVFQAPLKDNPNRAGFMTVAQLPFVFLFATKNSVLSLLWQRGYEKLNFLHRWAGRGIFLSATIHGAFWIQNHIQYNIPILGADKERLGVLSYAALGILVLSSLKPVRRFAYQAFFYLHIITFVTFFILLNYHTPYSTPWIFPPLVLYGLDLFIRLLRYRIKETTLVAPDNQMTLLSVEDCDKGWVAGQHIRVRTFYGGRLFESHPLTIVNAPPQTSCSAMHSLTLGARVNGDWSKSLNSLAREQNQSKLMVMLDGPYGGCTIDMGEYESVLLVAGGSGVTFTLALLDDIVGRIVRHNRRNGEITKRIEFAWCVRSFGNITWFAPMLADIATFAQDSSLELHISIFVTCLCDPESVPVIPKSDVTIDKPSVRALLELLVSPQDEETEFQKGSGGGLALAVSGPESLTREARNVVAGMSVAEQGRVGGVAIHTEVFSI